MLKASNTQFRGNAVARAGGIHISSEQAWLEGELDLRGVTVVGNTLQECGDPPITVDPSAKGVVIGNNTFLP